ncbi:MAG TPA: TIGR02301 family protein [Caulobacteraceae bacterium]|nr:TIGR02301 family protein [Caulobacteraceae bacterium]
MTMRPGALVLIIALLALSTAARAQDRAPAQRQTLIDLAYVLGESHALRQACEGPDDQYWRDRMRDLVRAETPDADLDRRLKTAFNSGFIAGQTGFPACGRASRREEARLAARGRALADSLTGPMANDAPPR